MRNLTRAAGLRVAGLAVLGVLPFAARADVVIQQQSTFDLAIIKAHGTTTESTTSDKQRRDTEFHCEGLMSLLCGNAQSGEIVRLDKQLTWDLEPKKKEFREQRFATPAERQAAMAHAQEVLERAKQCPATKSTAPAPDTSKCDMSPPVFDVKSLDNHAMFAGHDSKLTRLSMTQSCKNRQTGDTCDFMVALDTWLTADPIAGADEIKAFRTAHLKALGLDPQDELLQQQMKTFLAPYQDALRQIAGKSSDLKGWPMKTAVRIAFGGEHCSAAKQGEQPAGGGSGNAVTDAGQAAGNAATNASANAAGAAAGTAAANAAGNNAGSSILSSAANAFGSKLASGLFNKKKPAEAAPASAAAAPDAAPLPPGMVQAAQFSVETTAITPGPIPAAQFEVPEGWKLVVPKERPQKEFSCPKAD